jgi:hypothetical protein
VNIYDVLGFDAGAAVRARLLMNGASSRKE